MTAAAKARSSLTPTDGETICHVGEVDIAINPDRWPFERENAGKVVRFWKRAVEERPALHDGTVYILTSWSLESGRFSGAVQPTSYSSFLFWREQGYPEIGARNCFGSAVVRSREGYLLFGRMAPHTSTSGLVYPPGGSFGIEDARGGTIDVETNIRRELHEETGLEAAAANRAPGYLLIQEGPRISLAAELTYDLPAAELRQAIMTFIETTDDPELDDIVVFRRKSFARHHRMPPYARMLVDRLLTV
jgi:hypothetical protein